MAEDSCDTVDSAQVNANANREREWFRCHDPLCSSGHKVGGEGGVSFLCPTRSANSRTKETLAPGSQPFHIQQLLLHIPRDLATTAAIHEDKQRFNSPDEEIMFGSMKNGQELTLLAR